MNHRSAVSITWCTDCNYVVFRRDTFMHTPFGRILCCACMADKLTYFLYPHGGCAAMVALR